MSKANRDIALVLLAAGDSRRFGGNKLLADIGGKPMYRHLVDELERLPGGIFCRRLVVSQYPEILSDLTKLGYETVRNDHSDLGISHSIDLALQALGAAACSAAPMDGFAEQPPAVCFAVCDQPWLRGETVLKLIREWSDSKRGIGCLSCNGRDGNPAIFSAVYEKELRSLTGDTGGRAIIRSHPKDLYRCEIADPRELEDVDVREALDSYGQDSYGQDSYGQNRV